MKIKRKRKAVQVPKLELPSRVDPQIKPLPPSKRKQKKPRKNQPTFELRTELYKMAGVDLTAIDGCNPATIQVVLSEIGRDMKPWRTCGHFTSWLGLCPHNDVSGGKVLKSRAKKTNNRANTALRLAAQALTHSDSWLGAYYRRQRARLGAPKAIIATAHKIARIIYFMLKHQREFVDMGADHYEAQYRKRQTNRSGTESGQFGIPSCPCCPGGSLAARPFPDCIAALATLDMSEVRDISVQKTNPASPRTSLFPLISSRKTKTDTRAHRKRRVSQKWDSFSTVAVVYDRRFYTASKPQFSRQHTT